MSNTLDEILNTLTNLIELNFSDLRLNDELTYKDFAEYRDERVVEAKQQIQALITAENKKYFHSVMKSRAKTSPDMTLSEFYANHWTTPNYVG